MSPGGLWERGGAWAIRIAVVCAFLYLLVPIVIVVSVSFTKTEYLVFPPHGFTLAWYGAFVKAPGWVDSMVLSFKLAAATTVLSTIVGVPTALSLARSSSPAARTISAAMMSPLIIPQIVLGVGLLQYLSAAGLARTFIAIVIGHTLITVPFVIRSVIAAVANADPSLEEAAADLGARPMTRFWTITLPSIRSGLYAGGLFAFVMSWTNVEVTMFMTTSALNPLPVKIMNYIAYTVDPMIAAVSATSVYLGVAILIALEMTGGVELFTGGATKSDERR